MSGQQKSSVVTEEDVAREAALLASRVQKVLATFRGHGAYYEAKDGDPVVPYSGTYEVEGGEPKHFVGNVYYNYAKCEKDPKVLEDHARWVVHLAKARGVNFSGLVVIGAPMGGLMLNGQIAQETGCELGYPDKEGEDFVFGRHDLPMDGEFGLTEDVVNNKRAMGKLMTELRRHGSKAKPAAIFCVVNRAPDELWEETESGLSIPIVSIAHIPTDQFRQDDDRAAGREIFLKPKQRWDQLLREQRERQDLAA